MPGLADLNDAARAFAAHGTVPAPALSGRALWAASRPIASVPAAAAHCAGLAGGVLPAGLDGLRAHPGLPAGEATYPALAARLAAPDGAVRGLHVRLLAPEPPHGALPLLRSG